MKLAGFLLLLAGWGIVLCAVAWLPSAGVRSGFVLAGVGVCLNSQGIGYDRDWITRLQAGAIAGASPLQFSRDISLQAGQ
jgi:hypothetical protein